MGAFPTPQASPTASTIDTPNASQFLKIEGKPADLAHGYIYIIKSAGAHKIGKAKNLQQRLNELKTGNESPLIVEHCISTNAMNRAESLLHQHYAKQRGNGEWFTLSKEDVAYLKSIWRIDVKGLPIVTGETETPSVVVGEMAKAKASTNGTAPQE